MEIRSFLAFDLPGVLREGFDEIHRGLVPAIRDVRWVAPGNVHLTVVFLGQVRQGDLDAIGSAAAVVCHAFSPFRIALEGLGTFGGSRRPRVLWIGLAGDIDRMGVFRDALQDELQPFGIQRETRPFRPHLTLGRFRENARPGEALDRCLKERAGWTTPPAVLDELVLYRSDLRPGGAVYTRLGAWPLSGSS
ncbi:2'-5' RNA ligase [uncultured Desulfatiglans sp.]|nr:2'-5' RNA ligase [uncultured Desulfatiglans sp.]